MIVPRCATQNAQSSVSSLDSCVICQSHRDIANTRPSRSTMNHEKLMWNRHVFEVKRERAEYYGNRQEAVEFPNLKALKY